MNWQLRWLVLLMLVTCGSSSFGQITSSASSQVYSETWTFKDGAPPRVSCLAQANDGFLWLCASNGLFRFDGSRFEPFRSPFGDQLLSTKVHSLFAPRSGGLWVGYTFGGFSFLSNGRVSSHAIETGSISGFAQGRDGILWAGASSGLWRLDHFVWQHLGSDWNAPAEAVRQIGFDSQGTLWALVGRLGNPTDLIYLTPGARRFKTAGRHLQAYRFTLDADQSVLTEPTSSLISDSGERLDEKPLVYPLLTKAVQFVDRNNGLWTSPPDRPVVMRLPRESLHDEANNIVTQAGSLTYDINPFEKATLVDREGNIWLGEPKGLHRFFYSPLITQVFPTAASETPHFVAVADDNGAVWISFLGGAVDGTSDLYYVLGGKPERRIAQVTRSFAYRAPDKTLWFSGEGCLWHLVGHDFARVELPSQMANQSPFLQAITEDQHGGLWVSFGGHGLYRLADGVWTLYGGRSDIPKESMVVEFTDSLGRVWFGYTRSRLAVLDADRVHVFGPSDGLRLGSILAIYGRGAAVWIGGELGLEQFDRGRFHRIAAVDDELLRGISGIVETREGDLWLNGNFGIFHIRKIEISNSLKDSSYKVKGERFGRREGLPGAPELTSAFPTAIEGTDGRLWFTLTNGVVSLDPAGRSEVRPAPPPITIQLISADDKSYSPGPQLSLPARTSSVQISYSAVSLSDPESIRFRYKLQETDDDWHEIATPNTVSYRNLPPGSYHFNVSASDTNGVWSDKIASAEFMILPAFYQTLWFRSLCSIFLLAVLVGLYRLRLRRLDRQYELRLEERVNERTRIARQLHDTLLQSFQGLLLRFQVAYERLPARPAQAKQDLGRAIDRTVQAITEGRTAVLGLRASAANCTDLVAEIKILVEELASDPNVRQVVFHINTQGTPRPLRPIARDEICRVAGEALRNSWRHAQASAIEVELCYEEREFRLRVRDNGKGIAQQVLNGEGARGHFGLAGMRERSALIEGMLNIWTAPVSGTEIELTVPADRVYEAKPSKGLAGFLKRFSGRISGAAHE